MLRLKSRAVQHTLAVSSNSCSRVDFLSKAEDLGLVMYRAQLSSKAQAWARIDQAQAWIEHEPSPS